MEGGEFLALVVTIAGLSWLAMDCTGHVQQRNAYSHGVCDRACHAKAALVFEPKLRCVCPNNKVIVP